MAAWAGILAAGSEASPPAMIDPKMLMIALVYFADGLERGRCDDDGVLATATPGGRVVSVCSRFARAYRDNPTWGEIVLIHEALHTLGLGENPPSSSEISARVSAACR